MLKMLDGLKGKISKFKKPDDSIVNKLDKIKNMEQQSASPVYSPDGSVISPDPNLIAAQMGQIQEETMGKVEEMVDSKIEALGNISDTVNEMSTQVGKLDNAVAIAKRNVEEYDERFNKMEETILELLSLYEIVSNSINPFVGDSDNKPMDDRKIKTIEKHLNDLDASINHLSGNINQVDISATEEEFKNIQVEFDKKLQEYDAQLSKLQLEMKEQKQSTVEHTPEISEPVPVVSEIPDQIAIVEETEMSHQQIHQVPQMQQDFPIQQAPQTPSHQQTPPVQQTSPVQQSIPQLPQSSPIPDIQQELQAFHSAPQPKATAQLEDVENDSESSIILLNWVEFLMEKVGKNNLMDVLDYYNEIGWISEKISNKILVYASGIDYYDEKPTWKLMPEDHTKSLMFIERLCGKKMNINAIHKIERDMDKVKHHSEPYFDL
ncbi:MAG: hypothetical protein K8R25_04040 [Methanosarcinales archaeon]|nr:hypothetical protein [Methanosarcinales archaeon]